MIHRPPEIAFCPSRRRPMTDRSQRFRWIWNIVLALLILGLVVYGFYVAEEKDAAGLRTSAEKETVILEAESSAAAAEYSYIPAERLPQPAPGGNYRWDPEEKIVRFGYNVWIGWLPVIAANHGFHANADSIFFKKYGFRVEMVLMSDPAAARDAFADGDIHTLWGTVDMMVLHAKYLMRRPSAVPRIVQQIDWSSGGDGLVVRNPIQAMADLRNKTVALAKDTSSAYFLNSLLFSFGMSPNDLRIKHTATTFEAAAALLADENVDACVSRAPDMYKIPKREKGLRVLANTENAKRLLADVYAVRADFARDHPEIVRGLISGIFDGMDYLNRQPEHAARWMADVFVMTPEEILHMREDARHANLGDNLEFFLNPSNPTNFEQTWKNASLLYREIGKIQNPVPFDRVMDFTWLKQLQQEGNWGHQKPDVRPHYVPAGFHRISRGHSQLAQRVRINFSPNSLDPFSFAGSGGKSEKGEINYGTNAHATLEHAAMLAAQLGRAEILIEGHADSSMMGVVPAESVRELSLARAKAVQKALIERFGLDASIMRVEAKGWDAPADPENPQNQALNRRVEISVFPAGLR